MDADLVQLTWRRVLGARSVELYEIPIASAPTSSDAGGTRYFSLSLGSVEGATRFVSTSS